MTNPIPSTPMPDSSAPADEWLAYYVNERSAIFFRREAGMSWPFSKDRIFQTWKFTNTERKNDRTTRHLKAIYDRHRDDYCSRILFHCALYRFFGTAEFADILGWIEPSAQFDPDATAKLAIDQMRRGRRVFTGAYTITPAASKLPKPITVCNILTPLWEQRREIAKVARTTRSWRATAEALHQLGGFGWFMTKEVLQDALLTPVLEGAHDANIWTPVGPGAFRGLNRLAGRPIDAKLSQERGLCEILEIRKRVRPLLAEHVPKLSAHDIQFVLCEFDKFCRAREGGHLRNHYKPPRGGFFPEQSVRPKRRTEFV